MHNSEEEPQNCLIVKEYNLALKFMARVDLYFLNAILLKIALDFGREAVFSTLSPYKKVLQK